jgi:hypothetical protein
MRLHWLFLFAAALVALPFVALAQAAGIPDPTLDLAGFVSLLSQLWAGAQWAPLIAVAVVGLVACARKWGPSLWPWLATRWGGLALAGGMALAVSLAQGLLAGDVPLGQVVVNAILAALMAIGGHSGVKNALQGNEPKSTSPATPPVAGAAALLVLVLGLPLVSGCAALRANQHDLVCGIDGACVVCEGELVQDGVSRAVEVRYCEGAGEAPASAAVSP